MQARALSSVLGLAKAIHMQKPSEFGRFLHRSARVRARRTKSSPETDLLVATKWLPRLEPMAACRAHAVAFRDSSGAARPPARWAPPPATLRALILIPPRGPFPSLRRLLRGLLLRGLRRGLIWHGYLLGMSDGAMIRGVPGGLRGRFSSWMRSRPSSIAAPASA